jgi:AAA+ superfamily predicted ATPase
LKRSSLLPTALLHQFWTERRRLPAITLLSVTQPAAVQTCWQRQFDRCIMFELPNRETRAQIWQQAFPAEVPLSAEINWLGLAELPLNGAEILTLTQEALAYAAAEAAEAVGLDHILYTLAQHGTEIELQPIQPKKRGRKKT